MMESSKNVPSVAMADTFLSLCYPDTANIVWYRQYCTKLASYVEKLIKLCQSLRDVLQHQVLENTKIMFLNSKLLMFYFVFQSASLLSWFFLINIRINKLVTSFNKVSWKLRCVLWKVSVEHLMYKPLRYKKVYRILFDICSGI